MKNIECACIGVIARDIELKTSKAGKPWAAITIGCETDVTGDDGKPIMEWVKVAVFGEVAQRLTETVNKGDKLYCEGSGRLERWTSADGTPRTALAINAWKAEKIGASAIGRNKPKPKPVSEHQAEFDEESFA